MGIKRTKLAIDPADIGVIDVTINDKRRDSLGVELLFASIRHTAKLFEVGIVDEINGFIDGHTVFLCHISPV
jgi:hypothetical protein